MPSSSEEVATTTSTTDPNQTPMSDHEPSPAGIEIERKFLLRNLPPLPDDATPLRLEQGYLAPTPHDPPPDAEGPIRYGRLRRITEADGRVTHIHTVKQGFGLVREERELVITAEAFDEAWPYTDGRRLRKTRYQVRRDPVLWEIDVFDDLELLLAEAELPDAEHDLDIPDWIAPHIEREVTGDRAYGNSTLAASIARRDRPDAGNSTIRR